MSVFFLRMRIGGEPRVSEGLEKNQIIIGWSKARLMNPRLKEQQFKERMEQAYPDKSKSFFSRSAKKMWNFIRKMKVGDLVVVPSPKEKGFYVAEVTGDTEFLKDKKADDTAHRRSVKWLNEKKLTSYSADKSLDEFRKKTRVTCKIMDEEPSRYIQKRFTSPKRTSADGDKLYQQRARQALPILVRQAKVEMEISYESLAEELDMRPRNLNKVLDAVGISLKDLSKKWQQEIPRINAIVVNKNTGLPGSGIDSHIPVLKNLSKQKRKNRIRTEIWEEIFDYKDWDDVLQALELEPAIVSEEGKRIVQGAASPRKGGGGEGKEHKKLKQFIKDNPESIGIKYQGLEAKTERGLPSGDSMDVSFENNKHWIGIEVKSKISNETDITRGLFQCVKYQAVMEKQLAVDQIRKEIKVILVLGGKLTKETREIKDILGVEVIEDIRLQR